MDYTASILWLIAWPIVIFAAYRLIRFNLKQLK